jgi:hypothetical protein
MPTPVLADPTSIFTTSIFDWADLMPEEENGYAVPLVTFSTLALLGRPVHLAEQLAGLDDVRTVHCYHRTA